MIDNLHYDDEGDKGDELCDLGRVMMQYDDLLVKAIAATQSVV